MYANPCGLGLVPSGTAHFLTTSPGGGGWGDVLQDAARAATDRWIGPVPAPSGGGFPEPKKPAPAPKKTFPPLLPTGGGAPVPAAPAQARLLPFDPSSLFPLLLGAGILIALLGARRR